MAYTPREIKDRVAVGDDIFIVEDLGNNRIRLIPAPTQVLEPGTPINKALLQPIEDELGRLSSTDTYTQLDYFINTDEITDVAQIAGIKNSMFRGKNLGTSYTPEQQSQVASGKFLDLWVGDYWVINGTRYYIAAFNYYLGTGDQGLPLTTNHITLVPAERMYIRRMNPSNSTEGGYANSEMCTSGLDQAKSKIHTDFSGRVLTHRRYLSKSVRDGEASIADWFDSDVELMNEVMVFGSIVSGAGGSYNIGIEKSQLPLFSLRPDLLNIGVPWWLRDVCSAERFAAIHTLGFATNTYMASNSIGVRPVFSIF